VRALTGVNTAGISDYGICRCYHFCSTCSSRGGGTVVSGTAVCPLNLLRSCVRFFRKRSFLDFELRIEIKAKSSFSLPLLWS
jgi:hypothetical protein